MHTHNFFHWLFFENGKLLKKNLFIYCCLLFMAVLGLRWAFSNCREQGLLCSCYAWASRCSDFDCGAQALGSWASVVVVHGLSCSMIRGVFPDQG